MKAKKILNKAKNYKNTFAKYSYMTDDLDIVYTGNKKMDKSIDRGITFAINKIPDKRIKIPAKLTKLAPKIGGYMARLKVTYDETKRKK